MDDQLTFLNILEEKLGAISHNLWSYCRPKYWAQFIKASYRRNHFRQKFITGKIFATIHLRKKLVSIFRNSGSGIRNRTILFPDLFLIFLKPYNIWLIRSQIDF